jgi:hypothetical protein
MLLLFGMVCHSLPCVVATYYDVWPSPCDVTIVCCGPSSFAIMLLLFAMCIISPLHCCYLLWCIAFTLHYCCCLLWFVVITCVVLHLLFYIATGYYGALLSPCTIVVCCGALSPTLCYCYLLWFVTFTLHYYYSILWFVILFLVLL